MMLYNRKIKMYPNSSLGQITDYTDTIKRDDTVITSDLESKVREQDKIEQSKKAVKTRVENETISDESAHRSSRRAIQQVYDYARSNIWDYMLTLTFDNLKIDRYSYKDVSEAVKEWVRLMRELYPDLYYILIPEHNNSEKSEVKCQSCGHYYKNKIQLCPKCYSDKKMYAYHFHGLMGGCDIKNSLIHAEKDGQKLYYRSKRLEKSLPFWVSEKDATDSDYVLSYNYFPVYNFKNFNWGYTELSVIRDSKRASNYIAKHITKNLCKDIQLKNRRKYWTSKNLQVPQVFYEYLTQDEKDELTVKNDELITYTKSYDVNYNNQNHRISIYEISDISKYTKELEEELEEEKEEELEEDLVYYYLIREDDKEKIIEKICGNVQYTYWYPEYDKEGYLVDMHPVTNENIMDIVCLTEEERKYKLLFYIE